MSGEDISNFKLNMFLNLGAAGLAYLGVLFSETVNETKEVTLNSIETTSEIISKSFESTSEMLMKLTQYTGLYSVYSLLVKIVELIAKVPELIVTLIKNAIVFFYIFCVLVFIGQFDWLLEDVYTLTGISLLLTYLTYR